MGSSITPTNNSIEKIVGNGGSSGIIYLPIKYTGFDVKIIIPNADGNVDEILSKKVGKHKICGVIYVNKKHFGRTVKIILPEQNNGEEVAVLA
jgi:hypothetical protein